MISYRCRQSLLQKELTYELTGHALACSDGRVLDFAEIARIRLYDVKGGTGLAGGGVRRCVVRPSHGRAIVLVSASFLGLGRFEDRSEEFGKFVASLIGQVAAANPETRFITGMPLALWGFWALALAGVAFTMPLSAVLMVLPLLGDSGLAAFVTAVAVLAAIAFLLFYFARSLLADWPRAFDPRARKAD